jgi:hypothetical protein
MSQKLFIVGSGFTKSVFHDAPINKDLFVRMETEMSSVWKDVKTRYPTKDIEVAWTRLDLDISENKNDADSLLAIRRKAETDLSRFFRRFRFHEQLLQDSPWLDSFVRNTFSNGDVVVSLNYDCLLEGLLDWYELWSPNEGYGKTKAVITVPSEWQPSPVLVLKIHGSENFLKKSILRSELDKSLIFTVHDSIFPKSGHLKQLGATHDDSSEGIIAPSFVKHFSSALITLMLEALECAEQSELLVIIGCGIRAEDVFLKILLWRFVQGLLKGQRKIVILDPDAKLLCRHISETLGYNLSKIIHPIEKLLEKGYADLTEWLYDFDRQQIHPADRD